jgi:hypothetical protein
VVRRHPNSILDFPLPYPRVSHASAGSFIHCTTRSFDFHFSTFHSPLPTSHFPLPPVQSSQDTFESQAKRYPDGKTLNDCTYTEYPKKKEEAYHEPPVRIFGSIFQPDVTTLHHHRTTF